jgi:hypothetical protein
VKLRCIYILTTRRTLSLSAYQHRILHRASPNASVTFVCTTYDECIWSLFFGGQPMTRGANNHSQPPRLHIEPHLASPDQTPPDRAQHTANQAQLFLLRWSCMMSKRCPALWWAFCLWRMMSALHVLIACDTLARGDLCLRRFNSSLCI